MNRFSYVAPQNLAEAIELLNANAENSKPLAGGTDLVPQLKENRISPARLIDIKGIRELYGVTPSDSGVDIGPLTPLDGLTKSPVLQKKFPYLVAAILALGSYQIRCRGTIGGNICNASPAADCAPILLALEASLRAQSVENARTIPIEKFFLGPGRTCLKPNEILTSIHIPEPKGKACGIFFKHTRRKAMDLAIVNVGVILTGFDGRHCEQARIALGAVAPIPFRALDIEEFFSGKPITPDLIVQAQEIAMKIVSPISDLRASKEYRREMTGVFLQRALKNLLENKEGRRNA